MTADSSSEERPAPPPGVRAVVGLALLLERLESIPECESVEKAIADFAVAHLGADTAAVTLRPARWKPEALDVGAAATVSFEMTRVGGRILTLDLSAAGVDDPDPDAQAGLAAVARIIGHALYQRERRANLEKSLTTREMIGQAQGILMERYQLTSGQAVDYLRRISQDSQQKLSEIADRLVSGDAEPPADQA